MENLHKYRKKADQFVVAIQIRLETEGFNYQKWGGIQKCKQGDWLVDNGGDIYTVDADVFKRTYRKVETGRYVKVTPVWAKIASKAGRVLTKEGKSEYNAGDYIVYNDKDGKDAYCMRAAKFESMYEIDE